MTEKKVSQRYARALYQLAVESNSLETVYQDLKDVNSTIDNSKELELFFKSPIIKGSKKITIFKEIFNSKISDLSFKFVDLLISKQRESFVPSILMQFEEIYNDNHNISKAQVTTAIEPSEAIKEKLLSKISELENKTILPEFTVDENIKGGFKLLINGIVYDQSVQSKLSEIHSELTQN